MLLPVFSHKLISHHDGRPLATLHRLTRTTDFVFKLPVTYWEINNLHTFTSLFLGI